MESAASYMDLFDFIRQLIESGSLAEGTRLPTVEKLSSEDDDSLAEPWRSIAPGLRTYAKVRSAYKDLEALGYVHIEPRKGVSVGQRSKGSASIADRYGSVVPYLFRRLEKVEEPVTIRIRDNWFAMDGSFDDGPAPPRTEIIQDLDELIGLRQANGRETYVKSIVEHLGGPKDAMALTPFVQRILLRMDRPHRRHMPRVERPDKGFFDKCKHIAEEMLATRSDLLFLADKYPNVEARECIGWFGSPLVIAEPGPGWMVHGVYAMHDSSHETPAYRLDQSSQMGSFLHEEFDLMWEMSIELRDASLWNFDDLKFDLTMKVRDSLNARADFSKRFDEHRRAEE